MRLPDGRAADGPAAPSARGLSRAPRLRIEYRCDSSASDELLRMLAALDLLRVLLAREEVFVLFGRERRDGDLLPRLARLPALLELRLRLCASIWRS